jgi:thymidylate kinase
MQDALSQPLQPLIMPFNEFLTMLIQALEREGLRPCVLRNYEGFPDDNVGHDIDFIIRPAELPRAIHALRSIKNVRIVGYAEIPLVASVFLQGISAIPGGRSLQVDFFVNLCRKGLPYLPVEAVLDASVRRQAGNLSFYTPSPVHEAIDSLLASLVVGGWLKEKYLPKVQRTFASNRSEAIAALSPQFGQKASTKLVDSVIDGTREKIRGCVKPLCTSLALRYLLHRPFRGVVAIARHYARMIEIRRSPKTIKTVCVVGPHKCGKTRLIEDLLPILRFAAKEVGKQPLKLQLPPGRLAREMAADAAPHTKTTEGLFASMEMVTAWWLEEWLNIIFGKNNLTLRICERYYHNLLIEPKLYGFGGPRWFARLVGTLLPSPDLWILLDVSSEVIQSRNPQLSPAEILRQIDVYRAFVKTRKNYIILDASKPAGEVKENAYAAIIDMLAQGTESRLKSRFREHQREEPS